MIKKKGFTLIELLVVILLVVILASIAVPSLQRFYRTYKYQQYVADVENTIKWARIVAMERGINVGICVSGNNLIIYDIGTNRDISSICTGSVLKTLHVRDNFVSISGSGVSFDPRGLGISSGSVMIRRTDTNDCVEYTIQSLRGYIRKEGC